MGKTVNDLAPREDWKVFVFCTYFLLIMGADVIILSLFHFLTSVITLVEFTHLKQFYKAN